MASYYPIVKSDTIDGMDKKILGGALMVAFVLGLTMGRSVPKQGMNDAASTQPASATVAADAATTIPMNYTYYPVTKVVDGDTIAVDINGKNTTIRLIGLDTPETVDPRKPVQCFGEEASTKAKEVLTGKRVRIETDPSQGERDKYGRLLAYIFLEDGTLFNKFMIAEGYGHEYTYNVPYKYQKEFKDSEQNARENKLGLWTDFVCAEKAERVTKSPDTANTSVPYSPRSLEIRNTDKYECTKNVYNCSSFKTQAEAQAAFDACGGASNDIHKLDRDGDGKVCESLQ